MIRGYTKAELLWPGWRERIPGNPTDGVQAHGFTAATVDPRAWHATAPNTQGHGSDAPWDDTWGGTALAEGENSSDYVYRSSGEMRPRANASGGANVVFSLQTRRSAGYALSPGNYKALGAVVSVPPMVLCPMGGGGGSDPGCGPGPPMEVVTLGPGATNIVAQPPPSTPAPTNVTAWTVPPVSPAPSPTVSATPTAAATTDPLTAWLSQSTIIPGVENLWLAGGALVAAFLLFHHGGGK